MRTLSEQFYLLKQSSNDSLSYWSSLLNLIHQYSNSLDLDTVEEICKESERLRLHWNADHQEIITFQKNGKKKQQVLVKKGLGIEKADVYPNVYECLRQLQYEASLEEQEEMHDEEPRTFLTTELPLAAKSA